MPLPPAYDNPPLTKIAPGLSDLDADLLAIYVLRPAVRVRSDSAGDRPAPRAHSPVDWKRPTRRATRRAGSWRSIEQLLGQARGQADEILSEARRVADSQRERVRLETEEDRQRAVGGDAPPTEAETQRGFRRDPPSPTSR